MNCLKCGKQTANEQIFCDHCLAGMADHPVKPGTHVHLPKQAAASAQKKAPRKKVKSADELIQELKRLNLFLCVGIVVLLITLALTATALVRTGMALEEANAAGKNFTVDTTANE